MTSGQHSFAQDIQTLFESGSLGELTDRQLLERFTIHEAETSELAFAVLLKRHGPMVLRTCTAILRDRHAAEDATQATFLLDSTRTGARGRSRRGICHSANQLVPITYNIGGGNDPGSHAALLGAAGSRRDGLCDRLDGGSDESQVLEQVQTDYGLGAHWCLKTSIKEGQDPDRKMTR